MKFLGKRGLLSYYQFFYCNVLHFHNSITFTKRRSHLKPTVTKTITAQSPNKISELIELLNYLYLC